MIKIIHTSDWHLGLRFCGYDPSQEYELFFTQLIKSVTREKPDALLIVGDVFDIPIPANDLLERFERCLADLHAACQTMLIIITSGNHDDCQWLEKQAKRWSEWNVRIIGQLHKRDGSYDIGRHIISITDAKGNLKGYVIGMPYMTSSNCPIQSDQIPVERRLPAFMTALTNRVEMVNMTNVPVIAMAHCFVLRERLPGIERQKATMILEDLPLDSFDYQALGHAHTSKSIGSTKVRSCGSPWPITPKDFQRRSFSVVTIAGRKEVAKVSERWVKSQCPLVLLPKKPARMDTVLKQLAAFPENEQAFINLHVRADSISKEKEFIQRCKEITTGKKARLCSVVWAQGDSMRFSNIADTSYLSYGQSLSNKKETELPTLVANLQKSLNDQLTQLDKAINDLHRKEDTFTESVNSLRTQLRNLAERKELRKNYLKIKDEANYLQTRMEDPQYVWEERFIEKYKALKQSNNFLESERAEIKALNERKKALFEKAKVLRRGIQYTDFDLNRHYKKIENLIKQQPSIENTETMDNESFNSAQGILAEHQRRASELKQILETAQSRMQSIESLLGSSVPLAKGVGNKMDNLVEQLDQLRQEVIEVVSTIEQIKKTVTDKELSIETLVLQENYHPGLWSTVIWQEQQFIETLIREHRLCKDKKIMYDRVLDNLRKQMNAIPVNPKLEESGITPQLLMEFLEPWMAEQADRFKNQHSELERQQTHTRHRVNDINLIQSKLSESMEKEEAE